MCEVVEKCRNTRALAYGSDAILSENKNVFWPFQFVIEKATWPFENLISELRKVQRRYSLDTFVEAWLKHFFFKIYIALIDLNKASIYEDQIFEEKPCYSKWANDF